jgi:hypothetical protein
MRHVTESLRWWRRGRPASVAAERKLVRDQAALTLAACIAVSALVLSGCGDDTPTFSLGPGGADAGFSAAYGRWTPGPHDTCTQEMHDSYSVRGPDGKLYPTWHPPLDTQTGCSFGHEHGRDPRGSALFEEVGLVPFGHANEQLDLYDPVLSRHEDHVGHKIDWENDFELHFSGEAAGQLLEGSRCDALVKMHQGSHSKDAFTNNVHELVYHIRCDDGTGMSLTIMSAIGEPGEFVSSCNRDLHIQVGPATPLASRSPRELAAVPVHQDGGR